MQKKILVIEDELDILAYLMTLLDDHGFEACSLDTDASMLETIRGVNPDLIVLDVMMPSRSGVSIYRELRGCTDFDAVPVVILSGFAHDGGNLSDGFNTMLSDTTLPMPDGFIDKPVDVAVFISLVRKLTRKPEE